MTHSFDHYFHFYHLLGRFKTSVFVFILSICLTFCSLLLAFRFFSFRFTKGKHYISPWYPARCHCYCEKKHRFFCCCFGFFFVLFFFYFYFLNGSISYVLNSISECSRKRNGCWCWLKVGWMHWAAQIRRWIYFSFNGCVHLICCSIHCSKRFHCLFVWRI